MYTHLEVNKICKFNFRQVHIEYKVGTYNLPVELIQSPAIRTHEIVLTEAFRQANDINIGDTVYCVVGGGPPANDTSSDDSSNQSEVEFLNPELLIRMNDVGRNF